MNRGQGRAVALILALTGPAAAMEIAVEPAGGLTLQAAIDRARAGDAVVLGPGDYRQCAILRHDGVTIRAVAGTAWLRGKACQAKAALIVRAQNTVIDGLGFSTLKVADGNGAGIRLEKGSLIIRNSRFEDSEQGVLANAIADATVLIEDSVFERLGRCEPPRPCAHAVYIGHIASLTIRRSSFRAIREGHMIKSRAGATLIEDTLLDDGRDGSSSYLIDLPNGGGAVIRRNELIKGPKASNWTCAIRIGAEGASNPPGAIDIIDNRFENAMSRPTVFVFNQTRMRVRLSGNRLAGGLTMPLVGPAR